MLANAYFLAKFRFDTAENEPAKKFAKFDFFCGPARPLSTDPDVRFVTNRLETDYDLVGTLSEDGAPHEVKQITFILQSQKIK